MTRCPRCAGFGLTVLTVLGFGAATSLSGAQNAPALTPDEENTVEVVRESGPAVVAVRVEVEAPQQLPWVQPGRREGGGSGFVIDGEGRIITNYHVVSPALESGTLDLLPGAVLTVSFLEGEGEEHSVRVQGANPDFDLALLELLGPEVAPTVTPLPLGDSDGVEAGQKTIAIGSPFGLHTSVTAGIVSAIERERPGLVGIEIPFIQTDAAINPGNSGGPLLNSRGEVIGINNAILASPGGAPAFVGVGFAVPSNLLRESLGALVEGGLSGIAVAVAELPDRPRLGLTVPLTVEDYPPALRERLGLPGTGLIVTNVSPGSPADEVGIEGPVEVAAFEGQIYPIGGDILTEVEGEPLRTALDLQRVVLERDAGDEVTLTVWRDGEERTVDVVLEVVGSPGSR